MGNDMSGTSGAGSGGYRHQPDIAGEWSAGRDKSPNRLEMAPTADPRFCAVHSTADPTRVLIATPKQVLDLAQGIQEGAFGHLISN